MSAIESDRPPAVPTAEICPDFSSPDAIARPWEEARDVLERAGTYWVTTVRPDGRPHVVPLIAVWLAGKLYFTTGPEERKVANLAKNPHCILTTGSNSLDEGFDVVVEGEAVNTRDRDLLHRVAAAYVAKYGDVWAFEVSEDGTFVHVEGGPDHRALVFEVNPTRAFGFGKGEPYSQTRYRFRR
jgi:nitroimidazol reductase NimA-like FMN-containing flavoprotein (pyridoxamine 5'-phosphate oxidase superfamily)